MHPGEDWAESFAHYLHIRDTLEPAVEFGVRVDGPRGDAPGPGAARPPGARRGRPRGSFVADWLALTYALNRSMGREDLYPFTLAAPVLEKLAFVHERVGALDAPA